MEQMNKEENCKSAESARREKTITRTTLAGSAINMTLVIFKFVAGVLGHSGAMIADAVHSLSDLITDFIVIVFVHMGNKPQDADHDYGHGKYETLATAIVSIALFGVGSVLLLQSLYKIWLCFNGEELQQPGAIALVAALLSIALKEWAYQFTVRVGKRLKSEAVIANAWHHRSDAFSSIGTALGIGGAIALGHKWAILDPLAALAVSVFIIKSAYGLINQSVGELTEKSLPDNIEKQIEQIAGSEDNVSGIHHLRTRRIGNEIAIEMHVRMPGNISLYDAHLHATHIEQKLRQTFGQGTHIGIHVEPVKINGHYEHPNV